MHPNHPFGRLVMKPYQQGREKTTLAGPDSRSDDKESSLLMVMTYETTKDLKPTYP